MHRSNCAEDRRREPEADEVYVNVKIKLWSCNINYKGKDKNIILQPNQPPLFTPILLPISSDPLPVQSIRLRERSHRMRKMWSRIWRNWTRPQLHAWVSQGIRAQLHQENSSVLMYSSACISRNTELAKSEWYNIYEKNSDAMVAVKKEEMEDGYLVDSFDKEPFGNWEDFEKKQKLIDHIAHDHCYYAWSSISYFPKTVL